MILPQNLSLPSPFSLRTMACTATASTRLLAVSKQCRLQVSPSHRTLFFHQPSWHRRSCRLRHFSKETNSNDADDETGPFHAQTKRKQRQRSAINVKSYYRNYLQNRDNDNDSDAFTSTNASPNIPYDYFHAEVAHRLVDRLDDILTPDNKGFPLALEIGSNGGDFVYHSVCSGYDDNNDDDLELLHDDDDDDENEAVTVGSSSRGGVRKLVQMDACEDMLHRDEMMKQTMTAVTSSATACETYKLVADYETYPWSFPDGTFDLVISSMAFHWVNDLPKLLMEIKVSYIILMYKNDY